MSFDRKVYHEARKAGYTPIRAIHVARTLDEWERLESMGLVKIEATPDDEPYDPGDCDKAYVNGFGRRVSADQSKKELWEIIDRTGVWGVIGYARIDDNWKQCDSIWGCAGYEDPTDWRENWYVPDIMQATIDALNAFWTKTTDCAYG